MQNVELHPTGQEEPRRERIGRGVAAGGSAVEALLGISAVVLAILGLAGVLPVLLAGIAIIAAGASLLFEGLAVGASSRVAREGHERAGTMSGVGAEAIAGLATIALGILALVRIDPNILLPVAAIVLGTGVLFSASAPASEAGETSRAGAKEGAAREPVLAAAGVHTLVGLGAIVLGILGVLGIQPLTMTLVTALIIGAGLLLSGAAVGARVASMFRHGT